MSTAQLNASFFDNVSATCRLTQDDTGVGLSIYSSTLLINFVVSLPANVWIVWLICQGTREQLASEIHLLSLVGCEILFCLGLPAQLYCMFTSEQVSHGFFILLIIQSYLVWVCRPTLQFCICFERYIAVVHPLKFIRFKPPRYKVALCALAWFLSLFFILLVWTLPEEAVVPTVFIWFVPMLFMLAYFYFSVLCSLKRPGPGKREGEGKKRKTGDKIKRKAFNINLVLLLCFLLNYLPVLLIQFLKIKINISAILTDIIYSLGIVCGNVQPLFYLHRTGKLSFLKRLLTLRLNRQK